jgi:hypothetical protein
MHTHLLRSARAANPDEQPDGGRCQVVAADLRTEASAIVSSRGDIWRHLLILDGQSRVISTCKTAILSGVWSREQAHS